MFTAALVVLSTLTACGDGGGEDSASEAGGTVRGKPLGSAALEQAVVTEADLAGYEIGKTVTATGASRRTAEPAACDPVVQALGGSSGLDAVARAGRNIALKKDSATGAAMVLSSHSGQDAARVMEALRTAAEECGTFKDVSVGFRYDEVEVRPDPGYGDDSVSLRLTQLAALEEDEEPVRVPFAVLAVRKGATVALFCEFNRPGASGKADPAVVPSAIVEAQVEKLATSR